MKDKSSQLVLAIMTLIAVSSWVGFEVYRTIHTSTITPELESVLTPLNPVVPESVFTQLASRQGETQ